MIEAAPEVQPRRGIGDALPRGKALTASAVSLASIVAPLGFSTFYFTVQRQWPGAIWLSVLVVYAIAIPLVLLGTSTTRSAAFASA